MSEQHRQSVLIVEDNRDLREYLMLILQRSGYQVALAENGAQALDLLRAGARPRMVLLDVLLPVKNGFEFMVEQQADPKLADIPVVAVSSDDGVEELIRDLGAVTFMVKPVLCERLLEVVDVVCKAQRHREKAR